MKNGESIISKTGYPSIDRPWLKYYKKYAIESDVPRCSMYEFVKNQNADNLNNTALEFYGTLISYDSLFKTIERTAESLSALGIKEGEIISICMLNTPETIILIYALNMLGAVSNLICPISPAEELSNDINGCNSKFLFTLDIYQDKIASIIDKTDVKKVIVANLNASMSFITKTGAALLRKVKKVKLLKDPRFTDWKTFLSKRSLCNVCNNPDALAAIVYTGGTTGGSKGVELTNHQLNAIAWQNVNGLLGFSRNLRNAELLPFFIAYGLTCGLHTPLSLGVHMLIRLPMTESLSQLMKHKPNIVITIPNAWYELAKSDKDINLSFLTYAATGGDGFPPAVEEKINNYLKKQQCPSVIVNGYGMSEVGAQATTCSKEVYKFSTAGIPLVKNIIAAFDLESGEELKYEEEGELCINSPSIMKGYRNNEEATRDIIKTHKDGLNWVHTGDLGYIDSDGFVHVCGRLKRFYIRAWNGGVKKIFCPDAESLMQECPYIESCVIVPKSIGLEHKVYAFIIPSDKTMDHNKLIDIIKEFCHKKLGEVYRPDYYKIVTEFPLTKINKVDYRALEKQIETAI